MMKPIRMPRRKSLLVAVAAAAFGTVAAGSTAFAAGTDSGNASKPPSCNMKHTQADGKSGTVVARAVAGSTGETPAHKAGDKVERKLVASDGKVAGKVTTADGKTEVKTITLDGKADVSCASIELTEAKPAQKKAG